MEKIPILRMGNMLLVTVQVDLYDRLAENLEADLVQMIKKSGAQGVLIDISAVSIIDSFMCSPALPSRWWNWDCRYKACIVH